MENSIGLMILLQVVLIALNAVFACAEIAIISMNDAKLARLAAEGDKRAVRLARLTSQPARFLATIQVAITLAGFLGSAFAAENFSDRLVAWLIDIGFGISEATLDSIAVVIITVILSYFTLILGELVPKRLAMRKAESLALGMSGLIGAISVAFKPIVWFLTVSTNAVLRLLGIDPNIGDDKVSEEEIRMMVDVGSERGVIDPDEKQLIQNVFEFDDLSAVDIATHRTEIVALWLEDDIDTWDETIHMHRYTLYPVCDGAMDKIVGILNAKDYFRLHDKSKEAVLADAVSPAYYVPETVNADVLFRNMKHSRNNLAVVLDEYGGVSGIVTINDLVEQLVGEIKTEADDETDDIPIESVDKGVWRIHGSATLEEVSEALNITLPSEECETFNGLVFDALGSIPRDGTTIELKTHGLNIKIIELKDHQIERAFVRIDNDTPDEISSTANQNGSD